MVGAEVERVEVQPLGFDLRSFGDLPAEADEVVRRLFLDEAQRVASAEVAPVGGQGDVDGLFDEDRGVAFGLEFGKAGVVGLLDLSPGLADDLTGGGFVGLVE
jgi:hypothetical protein